MKKIGFMNFINMKSTKKQRSIKKKEHKKLVAVICDFVKNFAPSFRLSRSDAVSAGVVVKEEAETSLDCRGIAASVTVCCYSCGPVGKVVTTVTISVVGSCAFSFRNCKGTN